MTNEEAVAELLEHVAQATAEMSPDSFANERAWTTADMTVLAKHIAELEAELVESQAKSQPTKGT